MERRTLLAVALAITFLVGYQALMARLYPPAPPAIESHQTTYSQQVTSQSSPKEQSPIFQAQDAPALPDEPEETQQLTSPELEVDIGSYGGTIRYIQMVRYLDPATNQPTVLTQPDGMHRRLGFLTELRIDGHLAPEPVYQLQRDGISVIARGTLSRAVHITKRYWIAGPSAIGGDIRIQNNGPAAITVAIAMTTVAPLAALHKTGEAQIVGRYLEEGEARKIAARKTTKAPVIKAGQHEAAGQTDQYFALLAGWQHPAHQIVLKHQTDRGLRVVASWGPAVVRPGAEYREALVWYAGSQDYRQIADVDSRFARMFPQGLMGTLGAALLGCLRLFYKATQNYGVAILLLALGLSALLAPLTVLQMRMSGSSMTKMRELQPRLERLRAQYKNNPQKLNKETMALYKKHGVNPLATLGGCLPLLVQMPIFFALYRTLLNAVELRGAPFLWIHDLSAPDRLFEIPLFGGLPLNLLPLLMMGAMFVQQKLSPMQAPKTPGQPDMTKIMTLVFGVVFYLMPSGLVLYWLVNTSVMIGVYATSRRRTT